MGDGAVNTVDESPEVFSFKRHADEMVAKVDELEQEVTEVKSEVGSGAKDKDTEKQVISIKKKKQDAAKREAASAKRMQELMCQFATILRQIMKHKLAWPFNEPVDVEGLGLHDYYEVIDKPMDFSTIMKQMEAKDGTGYKNVREICADVRLVFKNAMTYNEKRSEIHVMAKTLLSKFEKKWLQFLPKVVEEERKRKEEEADAHRDRQLTQEAANV